MAHLPGPPWPGLRLYRRVRRPEIGVQVTSLALIVLLVVGVIGSVGWARARPVVVTISVTGGQLAGRYQTSWSEARSPVDVTAPVEDLSVTVYPLGQLIQIDVAGGGAVSCTITVDGEIRKQSSDNGQALCSMRLMPWH